MLLNSQVNVWSNVANEIFIRSIWYMMSYKTATSVP